MRELERLAHVCDPAEIHDSLNVFVEIARREENDRNGRGLGLSPQLATYRQPAQTGHHHVADNRIREPGLDHDLERLHAVLGAAHVEPVTGVPQLEESTERVVVFRDENAWWVAVRHQLEISLDSWFDCDLVIRWGPRAAHGATGLSQPFVNCGQGATLR